MSRKVSAPKSGTTLLRKLGLSEIPIEAEKAAWNAMEITPDDTLVLGNLALALMFQGETDAARELFSKFRGETLSNGMTWENAVRSDFDLLKEQGRKHLLMAEVEAAFGD